VTDEIDASGLRDFYLWYYFNYMAPTATEATEVTLPPPGPISKKGRKEIRFYAIIKVTALVEKIPFDEVLHNWQSNCNYELASSEQLQVLETQFIGVTIDRPKL
jgi:hypothetical protein